MIPDRLINGRLSDGLTPSPAGVAGFREDPRRTRGAGRGSLLGSWTSRSPILGGRGGGREPLVDAEEGGRAGWNSLARRRPRAGL